MRRLAATLALLAGLGLQGGAAAEGWLDLPVGCALGQDCWALQQFDHDPGPDFVDYACGGRAYDGHRGVDFGLGTAADMARDVPVLAAAAGQVKAVRDGEEDGVAVRDGSDAVDDQRACGNAVVLEHGAGWETSYCHMKRGSVAVRPGMVVAAGARLGAIGMSGLAEFPHLHFGVRYQDRFLDPFRPAGMQDGACGADRTLWTDEAAAQLVYSPLDLTAVGVAPKVPTLAEAAGGAFADETLPASAPVLAVWMIAWNVRKGDVLTMTLVGPDRTAVASDRIVLDRDRRRQFIYIGRRGKGPWRTGLYRAEVKIERRGADVVARNRGAQVTIR